MNRSLRALVLAMSLAGCSAGGVDPSPDQVGKGRPRTPDVTRAAPTAGDIAACAGKALGDPCAQRSICQNGRFGILACAPRPRPTRAPIAVPRNFI